MYFDLLQLFEDHLISHKALVIVSHFPGSLEVPDRKLSGIKWRLKGGLKSSGISAKDVQVRLRFGCAVAAPSTDSSSTMWPRVDSLSLIAVLCSVAALANAQKSGHAGATQACTGKAHPRLGDLELLLHALWPLKNSTIKLG